MAGDPDAYSICRKIGKVFCRCTLVAIAATTAGAQPSLSNAEKRQRQADDLAKRQELVARSDAAWDREMAREKAGDCVGANSTLEANVCLGREVEISSGNLKAYVDAFREIFLISFPEEWRFSGPTGTPPTGDEFVKQFDRAESQWRDYKTTFCATVFSFNKGGTVAPSAAMLCELHLIRSHMRELVGTLGEGFHR